jgi:hypothetical protein
MMEMDREYNSVTDTASWIASATALVVNGDDDSDSATPSIGQTGDTG